ncbi:hypothetical protein AVEN_259690-1 [Araneus ventricosus]|uniref:Uncharacterized protein n=1 Tax=Araneus ventricosus TaxID=182803 RepID=A0A4Y2NJY3_ARAVE|nr:hypothetical protein AVEN_259690-1 [Araneus ventricosus]
MRLQRLTAEQSGSRQVSKEILRTESVQDCSSPNYQGIPRVTSHESSSKFYAYPLIIESIRSSSMCGPSFLSLRMESRLGPQFPYSPDSTGIAVRVQLVVNIKGNTSDPDRLQKQMTIARLTERLSSVVKVIPILETPESNDERIIGALQGVKISLTCCDEIYREKMSLSFQIDLLDFVKPSTSK